MSKEMWIKAHERAVEEAMEKDPTLIWEQVYFSEETAKRADILCQEQAAARADSARDRMKDEKLLGKSDPTS